MSDCYVFASRGPLIESRHDVAVAVVDVDNRLIASAGDTELVAYWRSAAKPFQVMPLIDDGGIARFGLDPQMLALACGSHNAEPAHLEVAKRWLSSIGLTESDLRCGGHASLWPTLADAMMRQGITPTPIWSNCSGKHAALLGLALINGWPTEGYQELGHPVQDRVAASVSRWSGVPVGELQWGVDGCTAAAVATPLRAMALAYARLGATEHPPARSLREAMMAEPWYVAGTERVDTAVMTAWTKRVIVKAGAEGVFCASLPELGVGLAIKVIDGEMRASALALVRVLELVTARLAPLEAWPVTDLAAWRTPEVKNTRGEVTGELGVSGGPRFL